MKVVKMKAYHKADKQFYWVLGISLQGRGSVTLLSYGGNLEVTKKTVELPEVVILNFTGRSTRTGIEIFEADNVVYGNDLQFTGTVEWDKRRLTWMIRGDGWATLAEILPEYIEVISNAYQEG